MILINVLPLSLHGSTSSGSIACYVRVIFEGASRYARQHGILETTLIEIMRATLRAHPVACLQRRHLFFERARASARALQLKSASNAFVASMMICRRNEVVFVQIYRFRTDLRATNIISLRSTNSLFCSKLLVRRLAFLNAGSFSFSLFPPTP